jgi:cytochrome c-type biogenesis protein CcmE
MKNKYINLPISNDMQVQVKIEHEGIVVDVFEGETVIATTYKFFQELGIDVKEVADETND